MNNHGIGPIDLFKELDNIDWVDEEEKLRIKTKKFYKLTTWNDTTIEGYKELYEEFLRVNRTNAKNSSQKSKGDALEKLVNYIFENNLFLEVHPNKRNSTNEIDQFVKISDVGEMALHDYNWPITILGLEQKYMLCECKNYDVNVAATWIGKFNTLLDICGDCQLGIVFSYKGLSGQENNWYDAHGLTKIIYRISPENKKKYILDFNKDDFKKLLDKKNNIFKIIKAKKDSLITGVKSYNFLKETHDGQAEMLDIYNEIK